MNVFGIIAITGLCLYLLGGLAVLVLHRRGGRAICLPRRTPPVTILKPLKGLDDGLEENLETFFTIDYPDYEIVFGVADRGDPALAAVRGLQKKYPALRTFVSVGLHPAGTNPKVRNLLRMMTLARGELLVISDSNTRVGKNYLSRSVPPFDDPGVALVSHRLSAEGEETPGAVMDHLHVSGYITAAQAFAAVYAGITPIIGKSMVLRRSDLEAVGGLGDLADYLAEDYLLGRKLTKAGKRVLIIPEKVVNFGRRTTLAGFFSRHYRWLGMRWRINPFSCLLEMMAIPALWCGLWALTSGSVLYPALVYVLHLMAQQAVVARVRGGRTMPAISLLLSPLKDAAHFAILWASLFGNRVEWRGARYRIGWKTLLTPLDPPAPETEAGEAAQPALEEAAPAPRRLPVGTRARPAAPPIS